MAASSGAVTAWMWRRCRSRTMRRCCCCCCRRRCKLQKEQASAGVFAPKFAGETPTGRAVRAGAGPASDKAAKHPPHTSAQGRVPAHQRSRASNVDAVDDICGSGSKAERGPTTKYSGSTPQPPKQYSRTTPALQITHLHRVHRPRRQ